MEFVLQMIFAILDVFVPILAYFLCIFHTFHTHFIDFTCISTLFVAPKSEAAVGRRVCLRDALKYFTHIHISQTLLTFHTFHTHISHIANIFYTFHMQIWNATLFISLFDTPIMFGLSWVFCMVFIMIGSFRRWNALPVPMLRLVYKLVFLSLFWGVKFCIDFWSIFDRFLVHFWTIFGPFFTSNLKKKWSQNCIKF